MGIRDIDTFPVLSEFHEWRISVPYKFLASNEENAQSRAKRNHSQSLETLASRGGLSPLEIYLIIRDIPFREGIKMGMTEKLAKEIIDEWIRSEYEPN